MLSQKPAPWTDRDAVPRFLSTCEMLKQLCFGLIKASPVNALRLPETWHQAQISSNPTVQKLKKKSRKELKDSSV